MSNQSKLPNGITTSQLVIDTEKQTATCPAGFSASLEYNREEILRFRFPDDVCVSCSLRERCCTGKRGRTVCVGLTYPLLQEARLRQKTEAFKKEYHEHRSGVEGCLSALARGNGMRVSRYFGNRKRHLQAVFSGSAANLERVALGWQEHDPKDIISRGEWRNNQLLLEPGDCPKWCPYLPPHLVCQQYLCESPVPSPTAG